MFQLWTLGVVVNLFLFYSIFDIHFKSPIVNVERRHRIDKAKVQVPFKRAVFFGADGLRAETFYNYAEYRPYLTEIMSRDDSVWGISDTRVPTESRPGHVALFAGFYEDPSAVFTGWKENTVEFDTIFNQSRASVGLGSPDIVSIFAKGTAQDKMYSASYPREWQDFMGENLTMLDSWVFEEFKDLVRRRKLPNEDESVIFLHFLAIDTIGHSAKPQSDDYKLGMQYVDDIIKQAESIIEDYYGDKDTLYVFTSDHGMTNWGSHGDGSEHETETPFVIWGKGISSGASPLRLRQADFAALLAASLGVGYPSNSVGLFPASIWENKQFAFEALKANLFQILDLMETKKHIAQSNRNFPLINYGLEDEIQEKLEQSIELASSKDFTNGIKIMKEIINTALDGTLYYERYDRQLLILFTVITTILWITNVALIIVRISYSSYYKKTCERVFSTRNTLISLVGSFLVTKVIIGWSIWRISYGFLPIYLILLLLKLVSLFGENKPDNNSSSSSWLNSLFLLLIFCALAVEILVNSLERRGVLSLGLVLNAIWCTRAKKVSSWQKGLFFLAVAMLAIFPIMPVIGKKRDPLFVTLGPLLSTLLIGILLYIRGRSGSPSKRDHFILFFQLTLLLSVSFLCHFPTLHLTRLIAWLSLLQSYFLPVLISAETVTGRLISVFAATASPFSFISFSYEALFFPILFMVLMILLKIEMSEENLEDSWEEFLNLSGESRERRKMWEKVDLHQAVRRAWLHLFFVTLSFFGTGNIASVNSFDPSSTRCFVNVFSPWIMMLVLIEKILGPFLLVSCFFRRLLWSSVQVERSFLIVLLLCQGMALHTFFNVKTEGSWLEIGTSISHHVIVSGTTLFLFLLHFIADFVMGYEVWPSSAKSRFAIPSSTIGRSKIMKSF